MSDIEFKGDTEKEKELNKEIFNCTLTIAQKDDEIRELKSQLQQKENIIKEVREYIENHSITNIEWWITGKQKIECKFMKDTNPQELLEILDKPISKKSDNDF